MSFWHRATDLRRRAILVYLPAFLLSVVGLVTLLAACQPLVWPGGGFAPGQRITLALAPLDAIDLLWRVIPVAVGLGFWGASVVVFLLRPLAPVCRAFFLFGQAGAITLSTGQLSAVNVAWWATPLFYLALLCLPPLLVYLYVRFVEPTAAWLRAGPAALAVLSGLLALCFLLDLAHGNGAYAAQWRLAVRTYPAIVLSGTTVALVYTYVTAASADLRRRIRLVAFGTAAGFVPLLAFSLLPEVLNWGGRGLPVAHLPYQIAFLFLAIIPLSHAYAIVAHNLAPLDRLVNRSLVLFSLGALWAGLYLGGVELGLALAPGAQLLPPLVGGLATIAMAVVGTPLKMRIQAMVDRLFFGGWYDYRSVVGQISASLATALSAEELSSKLVDPVVEALRLRGGALYLADPAPSGELVLQASRALSLPPRLNGRSAFMAWLAAHGPLVAAQAARRVARETGWSDPGERSLLAGDDDSSLGEPCWLLPLVRDGRWLGLLLLGARRDDDFGEPAERDILVTLAAPASLAAHNVLLVADLRRTLRDLEAAHDALRQAHRQALAAREDERARLSWELHDGPVQDLIGLGYRLFSSRKQAESLPAAVVQEIEAARQEANRLSIVLRDICTELRSEVLDLTGLGPEIRRHAFDLQQQHGLQIAVDVPLLGPKLADPLGITLLRVYREAMTNIVRHAHARHVRVRFHLAEDGAYELVVRDDGCGFAVPGNLDALARARHFGLFNVRERLAAVGGQLSVQSGLGQGTEVRVWGRVEPPRCA